MLHLAPDIVVTNGRAEQMDEEQNRSRAQKRKVQFLRPVCLALSGRKKSEDLSYLSYLTYVRIDRVKDLPTRFLTNNLCHGTHALFVYNVDFSKGIYETDRSNWLTGKPYVQTRMLVRRKAKWPIL